eukprot:2960654-Pyramimonas_sp.AAC.1
MVHPRGRIGNKKDTATTRALRGSHHHFEEKIARQLGGRAALPLRGTTAHARHAAITCTQGAASPLRGRNV